MQNIHHLRLMSKRRRRIILLAGGILAVGLIWALLAPREREPSYRGRTVSQWLNAIDQGQWGAWDEAPIRAIGTNAIPACLKWISYEESPLRNRMAKLVERVSPALGRRLTVDPWGRSNRVLEVFRILGPQARAAIPELTRLAQTAIPARGDGSQPGRAGRCVDCLGFIGPDAIPGGLQKTSLRAFGSAGPSKGKDSPENGAGRQGCLRSQEDLRALMVGVLETNKQTAAVQRILRSELRRTIHNLGNAATNVAKTWDVTAGKDPS